MESWSVHNKTKKQIFLQISCFFYLRQLSFRFPVWSLMLAVTFTKTRREMKIIFPHQWEIYAHSQLPNTNRVIHCYLALRIKINIFIVTFTFITARIRRMTEGYIFTLCVNPHLGGGGGYPVSVKGKIFDTRFGLIHVQTGKKNFLLRDPPPPTGKGETILTPDLAWYMFRLEKKFFVKGPPPTVKGKILTPDLAWYMFRLEKNFFVEGTPPPQ